MRSLSKSKLIAWRQCPKRLWLEIHQPIPEEEIDPQTNATFDAGNAVGQIALALFDPKGRGVEIEREKQSIAAAFAQTTELIEQRRPIFEAGFEAAGARVFADILLPVKRQGKPGWRMIEVKSSTAVKDTHLDDTAIQSFVARAAGLPLAAVSVAVIDSQWTYPGGADYQGLLVEHDVSQQAGSRDDEVAHWIAEAHQVASRRKAPAIGCGEQCHTPYTCGYIDTCQALEAQTPYPVTWLPRIQAKRLKNWISDGGRDLREIPDDLLSDTQRRVRDCTLENRVHFDCAGAAADLAGHKLPAYFLDFETIQFAVPIWKGTRPFQNIPFQFSLHRLGRNGKLTQDSFLDLSGADPSRRFAEALIGACGERGPVFVYNEAFEKGRIQDLAERFPRLKRPLLAIHQRIVDLLPVARQRYYHPAQQGSWSIKSVLPTLVPELRYDQLDGVQDGGLAMAAFMEAMAPTTTADRKSAIERQLLDYCALDTYAMVRLWQIFAGRADLAL